MPLTPASFLLLRTFSRSHVCFYFLQISCASCCSCSGQAGTHQHKQRHSQLIAKSNRWFLNFVSPSHSSPSVLILIVILILVLINTWTREQRLHKTSRLHSTVIPPSLWLRLFWWCLFPAFSFGAKRCQTPFLSLNICLLFLSHTPHTQHKYTSLLRTIISNESPL